MKYRNLLFSAAILTTLSATAQQAQRAYAITSNTKGSYAWTEVKLIDLSSGEVVQTIVDNNGASLPVFNARTKASIQTKDEKGGSDFNRLPFSAVSAACAYDKKHERLYYAPLVGEKANELRYIDLNGSSQGVYYFEGEAINTKPSLTDESGNLTRMVIAADGNGYVLSNDGNHLIRFSTGRKPEITHLGALSDDPKNGANSIHTKNTSWGGDMIADAYGYLYVISAYRNVFKINVHTRVATFVATIGGMPADFTTNGAVVSGNSKFIVSSATSTDSYYEVDMSNWQAQRISVKETVYNASDLANGNLAYEEDVAKAVDLFSREVVLNKNIGLYPNPVSTGTFRVSFNKTPLGRYDVQLVDLNGRAVQQKTVQVGNAQQVENISITPGSTGVYMVKVLNNSKKIVFANKLVVNN